MNDKPKKSSPPYATYGSFVSFLNKLREAGIPNRIDPTVFGNASGSISYSVLSALKYLKLIDEDGNPGERFVALVNATDEARKPLLRETLELGYPTLFSSKYSLETISAGQFNDHIRDEFDVQGSTIDKIAAFFIAAARDADVSISQHLRDRKPIAGSTSSRKSAKQRRRDDNSGNAGSGAGHPTHDTPTRTEPQKPLQYQLIDLMSEPDIEDDVKQSIWALIQYLAKRDLKKHAPE